MEKDKSKHTRNERDFSNKDNDPERLSFDVMYDGKKRIHPRFRLERGGYELREYNELMYHFEAQLKVLRIKMKESKTLEEFDGYQESAGKVEKKIYDLRELQKSGSLDTRERKANIQNSNFQKRLRLIFACILTITGITVIFSRPDEIKSGLFLIGFGSAGLGFNSTALLELFTKKSS
ncbi:MAG: hypothetical protein SF052_20515 [Bacteroidia bacterium]|nr:hypothetical protein [Bacteroidia bacterium]